jgi:hypothetical protein
MLVVSSGFASRSRSAVPEPEKPARKATIGEILFGHFIFFLFGVAFPAFITAIVPVSITHFNRDGDKIRADVRKNLLFVIPSSYSTVHNVVSVNDTFQAGTSTRSRSSSGSSSVTTSEDQAFLVIEGREPAETVKVDVSPVNIDSVLEKAGTFLEDSQRPHLRLVTIANWKFGVVAGGLVSLLTLLYLYIVLSGIVRWIMTMFTRSPMRQVS